MTIIYDTYPVEGNCRGCGINTYYHIDGSFPLCQECAKKLLVEIADMTHNDEWDQVSNYINIIKTDYIDIYKNATVIGDVEG